MKKDGTDLREHVSEKRRIRDARFAADGEALYYLVIGPNTSEVRRAGPLSRGLDSSPAVVLSNLAVEDSSSSTISTSASGRLAYTRVSMDRNLWRADLRTTQSSRAPLRLRAISSGTRSERPRFSRDGKQILFARQDGELGQIVVASSEGEVVRTVVSRPGVAGEPVWSPDSASVAYWFDEGEGPTLHVWNGKTGADRSFGAVHRAAQLEWAPGARLLYRPAGSDGLGLVLFDPETGKTEPLIPFDEGTFLFSPRYSNRGDRIALGYNASRKKGIGGLATIRLDDREVKLMSGPGSFFPIGWSADDAFIIALRPTTRQVRVHRSDGKGEHVLGTLPRQVSFAHALERSGELKLVLGYPNDRFDLWVIDNFDGGRR